MSGNPTRSFSAVLSREKHLYSICLTGKKSLLHFPKRKNFITFSWQGSNNYPHRSITLEFPWQWLIGLLINICHGRKKKSDEQKAGRFLLLAELQWKGKKNPQTTSFSVTRAPERTNTQQSKEPQEHRGAARDWAQGCAQLQLWGEHLTPPRLALQTQHCVKHV